MKKLIGFFAMAMLVSQISYGQRASGAFTLNGKFQGDPGTIVRLSYANAGNERISDSAVVKDGRFSFKGNISEPTLAYLSTKGNQGVQIFLEPSQMNMTINANDMQNVTLDGSKTQQEWVEFNKLSDPIRKEMQPLSGKYSAANTAYINAKKSGADEKSLDSLKNIANTLHDQFDPFTERIAKQNYSFFQKHPQSPVTAFYLRFYVSRLSLDSLKTFYKNMGLALQQMSYGKEINDEIKKLESGSPGSMAKNFTTANISGQPLSLSDYRGKYVLLDFWASWCVPCRKANPHLKELYAKYKQKGFEVIGVSDDDRDIPAWKQAVAKDDLPWQHVLRGLKYDAAKGFDRSTDISELFGIHTLPTQILIDPTGKIVGRFGEGASPHEELDERLASALK